MKKIGGIILGIILFQSCNNKVPTWEFDAEIKLDHVKPIGIAVVNDTLWVSDGEGNRIIQINKEGEILKEKKGFERPMHITNFKQGLAIPEYGKDEITLLKNGQVEVLPTPKLDAPAGIDFYKGTFAIADFYHHKIHFYEGKKWISFGEKGKGNAQFHYPTDIHITDTYLYIADAYNHRIQVFDKQGKFIKVLAADLGVNAATGIFGTDHTIYLTDFENHRVLVLDHSGKLQQVLKEGLSNPTDVILFHKKLHILNFKSGTISLYKQKK